MDWTNDTRRISGKRRYFIALILILFFATPSYAADVIWGEADDFDTGIVDKEVVVVEIDTNKFVVAYQQDNDGDAIVGTVDGTTITWGSASTFDTDIEVTGQGSGNLGLCKLDTDKFVVAYTDDGAGDDGFARAVTVSTRTIGTWGTPFEFETTDCEYISCAQMATDEFIIAYSDEGDGNDGYVSFCTVSGTTISEQSNIEFEANATNATYCAKLDTDKFIVCYEDTVEGKGDARVGVISGANEISYGTENEFVTGGIPSIYIDGTFPIVVEQLDTDKFVVAWVDTTLNDNSACIGTVSTTTISYGDTVELSDSIDSAGNYGSVVVTKIDSENILFVFVVAWNSVSSNRATFSGATITVGDNETMAISPYFNGFFTALISTDKVVLALGDANDSNDGKAQIGDIQAAAPPPSGAPQVIIISEEEKEKKLQWVKEQFKKDYASGKIM